MRQAAVGPKAAVFACLLALALAGCGAGDRGQDVAAVAQRFYAALEGQAKKPCDQAILGLALPKGGTLAATGVYVQSAYALRGEGGTDFLSEGPDGWTISAAGC